MSDLPMEEQYLESVIEELRTLLSCYCQPAWTERGLHEVHCVVGYRPDLEALISEVRRLSAGAESATAEFLRDYDSDL